MQISEPFWLESSLERKKKSLAYAKDFFLVAGAGLAHILRARNFVFANKFAREDCLAKCHRHFSPPTFSASHIQVNSHNHIKSPTQGGALYMVAGAGLEPATLWL